MAATVLSGTAGALYYKPAGTLGQFAESDVDVSADTFTVAPFLNFKTGDPVVFSVVNTTTGGSGSGTLPNGISAGTTYYVIAYTNTTGVMQVSATSGGSTISIGDDGTALAPNKFQVEYASFASVAQVREWSFEITRDEIDVTTIGNAPGQFVPFRTFIAGFADGSGSATVYFTDTDDALGNRMIEDSLQRIQTGCKFKLYTDQVFTSGTVDNTKSRSIEFEANLTSASLAINPDDAQAVEINFRPTTTPSFDFSKSS
jgi:hypothetical protein|tara:strand:+ start:3360 stop:4133 length:774 start_codon:yes stop_codon:yes gene_type:complete